MFLVYLNKAHEMNTSEEGEAGRGQTERQAEAGGIALILCSSSYKTFCSGLLEPVCFHVYPVLSKSPSLS